MKKIEITNKVHAELLQVWSDNSDYREKYPTFSLLINHLINVASSEGFF